MSRTARVGWRQFPRNARSEPTLYSVLSADDRYRALIEQVSAVVFFAPMEGGLGEAYVSPQIEAILGFTQEEWLESPILWFRQLHPDDKDRWSQEAGEFFLWGTPLKSTYRLWREMGAQCGCAAKRRWFGMRTGSHGSSTAWASTLRR